MREGVCLRQHGGGGLGKYLVADECRHLRGYIHIRDTGFGGLQTLGLHVEVGHRIFQPILRRAQVGAYLILADDGVVQPVQGSLGEFLSADGDDVAVGVARYETARAGHGRPASVDHKSPLSYDHDDEIFCNIINC